jgi:hypothetical protein
MKTFKYNELTPQAQLVARLDLFDRWIENCEQAYPLPIDIELVTMIVSKTSYNYEFTGEVVYED